MEKDNPQSKVVYLVSTGENDWLQQTAKVSDWIILVFLTSIVVVVLAKLKFKMDFTGKLTLFLHFIVAVLRLYQDY